MPPSLRITLFSLAGLSYLAIAHHAATHGKPAWLVVIASTLPAAVALLNFAWAKPLQRWFALIAIALVFSALVYFASALVQTAILLYYLQDSGTNLFMASAFIRSVGPEQEALCTRVARIVHTDGLPANVQRYSRQLTVAWGVFFIGCALISTVLFWQGWASKTFASWSWFANVAVWPLTLLMFVVEYGVRLCVIPKKDRVSLRQSVHSILAFYQK